MAVTASGSGRDIVFNIKVRNAAASKLKAISDGFRQLSASAGEAVSGLHQHATSAQKVFAETAKLRAETDRLGQSQTNVGRSAAKLGANANVGHRMADGFSQAHHHASGLVGAMEQMAPFMLAMAGMQGFAAVGTEMLDFEKNMAKVNAAANAGNAELAKMSELSLRMGASMTTGAAESAAALNTIVRAGVSAADSQQMLKSALTLAGADDMDPTRSTEILVSTLKAFQIEASRSADVADVLAMAATQSKASIDQIGETMKYAAPVASAYGVSLNETAAAIATLADNGIQGSMAGTALSAILSNLSSPTAEVKKGFKQLGVEAKDVDARVVGLYGVLKKLNELGLGDAKNAPVAKLIAGREAQAELLSMVKNVERYKGFLDGSMNASGEATRLYATATANLKDRFKELVNVVSLAPAAIANVGQGGTLLPNLSETVTGITDGFRVLLGFGDEIKGNASAARQWAESIKTVGVSIGSMLGAVTAVWAATKGIGLVMAAASSPVALLGVAVGGAALAFWKYRDAIYEAFGGQEKFQQSVERMLPVVAGLGGAILGLTAIRTVATALSTVGTAITGIAAVGGTVVATVGAPFVAVAAAVGAAVAALFYFRDSTMEVGGEQMKLRDLIGGVWDYAISKVGESADWIAGSMSRVGDFVGAAWQGLKTVVGGAMDAVGLTWSDVTGGLMSAASGTANTMIGAFLVAINTVKAAFFGLANAVGVVFSNIGQKVNGMLDAVSLASSGEFEKAGRSLGKAMGTGLSDGLGDSIAADIAKLRSDNKALLTTDYIGNMAQGVRDFAAANRDARLEREKLDRLSDHFGRKDDAAKHGTSFEGSRLSAGDVPGDIDEQGKAAKKFGSELEQLVNKLSPAIARQREYTEAQALLAKAAGMSDAELSKFGLTQEKVAQLTELAKQKLGEQATFFAQNVKQLDDQARLLRLGNTEREIESDLLNLINQARQQGEPLAQAEIETLREKIKLNRQLEKESQFKESFKDRLTSINDEIRLLPLLSEQREIGTKLLEVEREARKAGITDINGYVNDYVAAMDRLRAAQDAASSNPLRGAQDALAEYVKNAKDSAGAMKDTVGKVLTGIEDAMVELATTGKMSFKDMANSILADVTRMASRHLLSQAAQWFLPSGGAGGVAQSLGVGGVQQTMNAFNQNLGSALNSGAAGTADVFGGWLGGLGSLLSNIASGIGSVFSSLVSSISSMGSGGGGSFFSGIGSFVSSIFSLFHDGGIAGMGSSQSRMISPLAFAGAPRYHTGGIAGLRPDEVPAVLRRGEEVITRDDPRHRGNGGGVRGGDSFVFNVTVNGGGQTPDQMRRTGQQIGKTAAEEFERSRRRNG